MRYFAKKILTKLGRKYFWSHHEVYSDFKFKHFDTHCGAFLSGKNDSNTQKQTNLEKNCCVS